MTQLSLPFILTVPVNSDNNHRKANYGTFQDSKNAPVHRWFQYPAGFSYRAVAEIIRQEQLRPGQFLYDPFMGTGTTLVTAKGYGIESYGIEAHPFVYDVAATKLFWDYDFFELAAKIRDVLGDVKETLRFTNLSYIDLSEYPELVRKCLSDENLARLHLIKHHLINEPEPYRRFFRLALTCALRIASSAATGWPYIAPKKRIREVDGLDAFEKTVNMMYDDLYICVHGNNVAEAHPLYGDCRDTTDILDGAMFDAAFTSPPYLNNYDYADRTRFELYFWGLTKTWGEITEKVRTKLITSATTQINRNDYPENPVDQTIREACPDVYSGLVERVRHLSRIRLTKGGKKSYDLMVAGYFNDMFKVLRDVFRVMKKGTRFILVLGDSAPYGIYIPIYDYLGQLALSVGFTEYHVEMLRHRGGKWKNNPQRHSVELSEGLLFLKK